MSKEANLRRSSRRVTKPVRYVSDSESSDNESNDNETNDIEYDTRPTKRRKATKETKINRENAVELPDMQNALYDCLADEKGNYTAQALEWLEMYQNEDHSIALVELANCLIKLSGSNLTVQTDIFAADEDDDEEDSQLIRAVENLEKQLHIYPISEYSLNHRTESKLFRKSISQFIINLIKYSAEKGVLYENDGEFLNPVVNWAVAMSSSHCRAFRHVGTYVSLNILGALIKIQVERQKRLAKKEQQLSKGSNAARKRVENQCSDERSKIELTSHYIYAILETVFSLRQKDVDPKIRLESFKLLGNWTLIMPELFLVNDYLRYFGWALSDPSAQVRQQVVTSLLQLYKAPNFESSLRQFSDRFLDRFIEMASYDSDSQVRKLMVDLLSIMTDLGFANGSSVTEKVSSAIFDSDSRVRKSASIFLLARIQNDVKDQFTDEPLLEEYLKDHMEPEWYFFKQLSIRLIDLIDVTRTHEKIFNVLRFKPQPSPVAIAGNSIFEALEDKQDIIQRLADMLLFDYSSLPQKRGNQAKLVQTVCIDDKQAEILIALLQGFFDNQVHREMEKSKKKSSDVSIPIVAELQGKVSSICQSLMTKYHYSTRVFSQILRLLSLINHDIYATLNQTEEEKNIFDIVLKEFLEQVSDTVLLECSNILMSATESSRFKSYADPKILDAVKTIELSLKRSQETDSIDESFLKIWMLKSILLPTDPSQSVYGSIDVEQSKLILQNIDKDKSIDLNLRFLEFVKGYTASRIKSISYKGEEEILTGFIRGVYDLHKQSLDQNLRLETALTIIDCFLLLKMAKDNDEGNPSRFENDVQLRSLMFESEEAVVEFYKRRLIKYAKNQEIELELDDNLEVEEDLNDERNENRALDDELQICTLAAKLCTGIKIQAMTSQTLKELIELSQKTSSRLSTVIRQAKSLVNG